ncbi:MAG: hypothetical protein JKY01_05590 [Pseudomonadales bacterium]|nr:hypothetical protein [Pseudomonadales bacterium]
MKAAKKISSLPFVLTASAALLVGISGCSDRNRDLVEASGLAIDHYLLQATVCVDINSDKQCSDNEPRDITDGSARFSLGTFTPAPLVVLATPGITTQSREQGGVGDPIERRFFLTAPLNSSTVTPLTTLVQVGVEQGIYADFNTGAIAVSQALNVPFDTDIQNYDYLSAGDVKVSVASEIIGGAIADAIANIEANVTGPTATTENILETAVKVLIDPSLAGNSSTGSSLMEEIGDAVDAAVDAGLTDIFIIEKAIEDDSSIISANDVDQATLEAAVEETNTVNVTGEATGATGASA